VDSPLKETSVKFRDAHKWKESDVPSVNKDMLPPIWDVKWPIVFNLLMEFVVFVKMDIDRKMAHASRKK